MGRALSFKLTQPVTIKM